MIYISHRGNLNGPDPKKENTLQAINECIEKGYEVEVDVWYENKNFYLGHDEPILRIDTNLFKNNKIWFHLKNRDSLEEILKYSPKNYFWHENDLCTITSSGNIWLYPNNYIVSKKAIFVLPELNKDKYECLNYDCYGICSDYINLYLEKSKIN